MTRDQVMEKVREFMVGTMDCREEELTEKAHLVDELEIDSLAVLELTVFTEETFDVSIEDAFKEALQGADDPTLGWLVDVLHDRAGQPAA